VNFIALVQTQLAQPSTKLQDKLLKLDERQVGVATQLKIGPLLVDLLLDAVDHLLDLLVLDVGAEDATGADAFGIAKEPGAALQDVKDGHDVVGGARDELVLALGDAARNGLALDGLVAGRLDGKGAALGHSRQEEVPVGSHGWRVREVD
jgi:hypothetical protein